MSEIEIDVKVKIFDDPEYCNKNSVFKCGFLDLKENNCLLYPIFDEVYGEVENGLENYFDGKENPAVKCPECKEAYQKALKEKKVKKCSNCGAECEVDSLVLCPVCDFHFSGDGLSCCKCKKSRKIVEGGGFECPCPHCGDELPF